ncbi:TIGR02391 family protein [Amycolatopsis sp. NBC_01307]|nr:TIGR02391 family protein [Amycolatopsis sp. NBC_01307]
MTWTRPKAETLALPIDALALLILHDYKAGDGWNWQNWMRGAEQQGTARDREIGRALSEGWSWLMTHGLVVRDPSQPSADAYVVSRLGEETLRYGVGKLAAAERLGMSLHPRIAQLVEQQFLLGEYDVAVFVAMREVEIRVRDLAGASDSDLGTKLIDKAFAPGDPRGFGRPQGRARRTAGDAEPLQRGYRDVQEPDVAPGREVRGPGGRQRCGPVG